MYRVGPVACLSAMVLMVFVGTVGCGSDSDPGDDNDGETLNIAELGEAELSVDPQTLVFSQVSPGITESTIVEVDNVGEQSIDFDDIYVRSGDDYFGVSFLDDGDEVDAPPAILDDGAEPVEMLVNFRPDDFDGVSGELAVVSDDLDDGEKTVDLFGNDGQLPCLATTPGDVVDFGPSPVDMPSQRLVSLQNCASEGELVIDELSTSGDEAFDVDELDDPLILGVGESVEIPVEYGPDETDTHTGELTIVSDDTAAPNKQVALTGEGTDADCPVAEAAGVVGAQELSTVETDDLRPVDLTARESYDPEGSDLTYQWSILSKPTRSSAAIEPETDVVDPELRVDLLGDYTVELIVYNEDGVSACKSATVDVEYVASGDIQIELLWESPRVEKEGGVDGNAQRGTDLDFHYALEDTEFGEREVINWTNTEENWGDDGTAWLSMSDNWGRYPEALTHADPRDGGVYRVAAHYYCDKSFGPSDATVRVFFGGELEGEYRRQIINSGDLWHVGDVEWGDEPTFAFHDQYDDPSPKLTSCEGLH